MGDKTLCGCAMGEVPASSLAMASPSKKSLRTAEHKRADVRRDFRDRPSLAP